VTTRRHRTMFLAAREEAARCLEQRDLADISTSTVNQPQERKASHHFGSEPGRAVYAASGRQIVTCKPRRLHPLGQSHAVPMPKETKQAPAIRPPRESHRHRSFQAQREARTRFHHSESPTATATSNPPAPANHDAMSTCFLTTVTWLGRSPSAPCSWSALSAL